MASVVTTSRVDEEKSKEALDDSKTPQEKMLERMSTPENREKIRVFLEQQKKLCSNRSLSKYDTMTKAEIAMDKAKKRGWI